MAHTYEDLKHKTVAELREIAAGLQHEAVQGYSQLNKDHLLPVQGYSQLNKDHLLPALCKALGIEAFEHHAAASSEKAAIKAKMREIRTACDQAREAGEHQTLHNLRRQYHHLNHSLRASAKRATLH